MQQGLFSYCIFEWLWTPNGNKAGKSPNPFQGSNHTDNAVSLSLLYEEIKSFRAIKAALCNPKGCVILHLYKARSIILSRVSLLMSPNSAPDCKGDM